MKSVCLASLNGEKYIKEQIKSILDQLDESDELIIVDSGSSDKTIEIINSFKDKRIKLLFFDNSVVSDNGEFNIINKIKAAFLFAIKHSRGETVYLSDQDDLWLPNKVRDCEEQLSKYDVICHNCEITDESLTPIFEYKRRRISYIYNLKNPPFQGCCMAFSKKVATQVRNCEDFFLKADLSHDHLIGFISMIFNGKRSICIIPKSLILYRRHGNNVSSTGDKSSHSLLFKIIYRINILSAYCRIFLLQKQLKSRDL